VTPALAPSDETSPRLVPAMRTFIAIAALALARANAIAGAPESRIGELPGSVSIALEIRDGEAIGATPAGMAIGRLLSEQDFMRQTADAWRELAGELDLDEDEAYVALLGGHVLFASDAAALEPDKAGASWAVLATIDPSTQKRLKSRLKPAPRKLRSGRAIYALEQGRFVLTMSLERDNQRVERNATILMAPARAEPLFDAMLPLLDGKPGVQPLQRTRAFRALEKLGGEPDASLIVRWPGDDARFGVASIGVNDATLEIDTATSPGMLWGPSACCEGLELWDGRAAKAITDRRIAALAIVPGSLDKMSSEDLDDLRELPVLGPSYLQILPFLGDRLGVAVDETGDNDLELLVVAELSEALDPAEATALLDAKLATAVAFIAQGERGPPDFHGRFPNALRVASLTPEGMAPAKELSWRYTGAERIQWLVARVGPPDPEAESVAALANALAHAEEREGTPRVSVGGGRPAQLVRMLKRKGVWLPIAPFTISSAVERVEWDAWLEDEGVVRGVVLVEMAPPTEPNDPEDE